ncbi:MAG: cation:proton antiporter [archaeon]|nr:cation:proton antiporter [archaeon]
MGESVEEEKNLTIISLLAIVILTLYTVAAPIFEKYNFHYMHESGLCMIIGVLITLLAKSKYTTATFTESFNFNDEIFFTFILPPIIFSAGYNLRRTTFFKYFMYISAFGVIGTVTSFLVVSPLTYIANKNDLFTMTSSNYPKDIENKTNETNLNISEYYQRNIFVKELLNVTENLIGEEGKEIPEEDIPIPKEIIHFTVPEILLFASVISATDTIAALTFVHEETEPKLFSILFGEGVLNGKNNSFNIS